MEVPQSHCMSDRMFLPFEVDSHGWIASVQRRVKGYLSVIERMNNLLCAEVSWEKDLQSSNSVDGFRAWWFSERSEDRPSMIRAFGGCLGTRRR